MPGATPAAPSFGMRGSYNDYLSMPAGNMTSAYGRELLRFQIRNLLIELSCLLLMGELCGPPGGNAVAAHLTGMHSAIKMLNSRIRILHHHLVSI
ncbi:unnamed protein product [Sphagnum jensenii]|uniref:Uncharacterized protein n=1 Tax=Sphagnum jensenii TaxID=128206 RepID=A0ABP0VWX2_9BRYO